MLKKLLEQLLGSVARAVVKKYRPKIVAITGSVGKTTTRAACVAVLGTRFRVRGSAKNYNNEIGVPITVIGVDAPGRSVVGWLRAFARGMALLVGNDALYPQVLVVEMGADHPGDIAYLMSIAPPDVGVVTAVSAAHTEFFGSVENVLNEKKTIVVSLSADKTAVVNVDDERLQSIIDEITAPVMGFGFSNGAVAQGREVEVRYTSSGEPDGMEAVLLLDGHETTVSVPRALGRPVIYAALAAAAVGRAMELDSAEIQLGLSAFEPPAGRMRIIPGIKRTVIVDDTYNSSPKAVTEALAIVSTLHTDGRRIAVLGDMLELGSLTEQVHRDVGNNVALSGFDLLLTVGPAAHFMADQAKMSGMDENTVFSFDNSADAGKFLQERMKEGDIVLVKGSQGVRCEKIVKEVMAHPELAEQLLVRQSTKWK